MYQSCILYIYVVMYILEINMVYNSCCITNDSQNINYKFPKFRSFVVKKAK